MFTRGKRDVQIPDAVVRGNVITTKYNTAARLRIKILELDSALLIPEMWKQFFYSDFSLF